MIRPEAQRIADALWDHIHSLSRAITLNRVVDVGTETGLVMTPEEQEVMAVGYRRRAELMEQLGAVVKVVRPVDGTEQGALPDNLKDAYEQLWMRVYGSGALYLGDPNSEKVAGANSSWAVKGGAKAPHRSGAKRGKSPTAHKRNVVLDGAAYDKKRAIDKRLGRVTREIRLFLAGELDSPVRNVCPSCGKIGELTWRNCPACGDRLEQRDVS